MIVSTCRDNYLVFKDYYDREVIILQEDYLKLMSDPERRRFRPVLDECLADPTEVWWDKETVDGNDYFYFKYFKFYKDGAFIAWVLLDESQKLHLNNFYGFGDEELDMISEERCGQLIRSSS